MSAVPGSVRERGWRALGPVIEPLAVMTVEQAVLSMIVIAAQA